MILKLLLDLILCDGGNRHDGGVILLIRISDDDNRTNAVPDAVIANAPEPAVAPSLGGAESPAPHDDSTQPQPLHLQTQPLLHVMILHNVDFERDLSLHQRLRQVGRLCGGERVEIDLELLLRLLVLGVDDGEVDGAPIGAVEDGGGADMDQNDGVAGADVVVNGPFDGEGGLVAEIDGDADLALGVGSGGFCGERGGRGREARGGGADLDGGEWWQVGVRLHCGGGRVLGLLV